MTGTSTLTGALPSFNSRDGAIDRTDGVASFTLQTGFNSRDGAIDRGSLNLNLCIPLIVSIPEMVRLIGAVKSAFVVFAFQFQFQRWCD